MITRVWNEGWLEVASSGQHMKYIRSNLMKIDDDDFVKCKYKYKYKYKYKDKSLERGLVGGCQQQATHEIYPVKPHEIITIVMMVVLRRRSAKIVKNYEDTRILEF